MPKCRAALIAFRASCHAVETRIESRSEEGLHMRERTLASGVTAVAAVAALTLVPGFVAGQTKASFDPPRTSDGQPDIHGYYSPDAPDASHSLEEGAEPENSLGRGRTPAQVAEAA